MKSLYLSLLISLCTSFVYGQNTKKELEKFRTGKFTYLGQEEDVVIIRTKKQQTETYNQGKSKLILKIEWVNDSTYVLTHQKAIEAPGCLTKGDWIKTIITSQDGNKYTCTYTSNKCGSGEGTIVKLE